MLQQKIVLHFPAEVVEQPIIYFLVREFNLMVNILRANINPRKEGRLVLEVRGEEADYQKSLEFMESQGLKVSSLDQEITWIEERCTQCGACSVICPTGALSIKRPEMTVSFDDSRCIVCEHCLKACPARAVEARF